MMRGQPTVCEKKENTTRPLHEVENEEDTRFFGLTRECGLHDINMEDVFLP